MDTSTFEEDKADGGKGGGGGGGVPVEQGTSKVKKGHQQDTSTSERQRRRSEQTDPVDDDDSRPEEADIVQDIDGTTAPHDIDTQTRQIDPSRPAPGGYLSTLGRRAEGNGNGNGNTIPGAYRVGERLEEPTTTVVADADRARNISHQHQPLNSSQLRELGVGGLGNVHGGSDYYLAEAVAVPDASCVHHEHDNEPTINSTSTSTPGGHGQQESAPDVEAAAGGSGGGGGDNLIPHSVVQAESMAHKLVWTRRRAALSAVAVALLVVAIVLAVVLPLASSRSAAAVPSASSASSSAPLASASIPPEVAAALEKGVGQVCIPDPENCGCAPYPSDYVGRINVTESGKECMRWDAQFPHEHVMVPGTAQHPASYLVDNYCRNPDSHSSPWCYTTDPETRWENCNVPKCETYEVPIGISQVPEDVPPLPSDLATLCEQKQITSGLKFNGKTQRIVIPNSSSSGGGLNLNGDPFTIEVWIKPKKKVDFSTILSNKEGGADKTGFLFSINTWQESDGRLYLEGTNSKIASTVSVEWGVWQHVAVAYDGTAPAFFLNGVQIPYYPMDGLYGPFTIKPSWLDTRIGDMALYFDGVVTADLNSHFAGVMDELRVWDHAKTIEEIRGRMYCELSGNEAKIAYNEAGKKIAYYEVESEGNKAGLVAYYQFESNGVDLLDSSPNANHGQREGYAKSSGGYVDGMNLCQRCTSI